MTKADFLLQRINEKDQQVQKILRRVIKHRPAMAVVVETNSKNSLRSQLSLARCVADQLPEVIVLQTLNEGKKMIFKRSSIRRGFKLNYGPKFNVDEVCTSLTKADIPASGENISWEDDSTTNHASFKDENGDEEKVGLKSISVIRRELPESNLGWPLLRRNTPFCRDGSRRSKARSMSLIEWVMSLPSRSSETKMQNRTDSDLDEVNISFDAKTEGSTSTVQMFYPCENESADGSSIIEYEESGLRNSCESESIDGIPSGSFYALTDQSTQLRPGWPLLRIKTSAIGESVEEYGANNQSKQATLKSQSDFSLEQLICLSAPKILPKKVEIVLKLKSSGCKQFTYKELERATHKFSSENLIGEGGRSNVYKGCLHRGKLVAVKVVKPYKEAWNDFFFEVDITCSLKHKHITHLIGACVENNHLILVYDFLYKGSLEEILRGNNEKSILPWKVRFKLAIAIAEALNYLHNECSRPVIHRDVKSSNILLSNDFQPQLSDFGLAIWGAADSTYTICSDIVGTFGYIAPEYFMHGRVSDKIDIYSFGVVLLELLTGNKPISSTGPKGQESLVKWAMPLIESGNLEALLDPKLDGEFEIVEMHRMILVATLCVKQSPRLRPKASQILKLLRGEKEVRKWMNDYINDLIETSNEEFDDLSLESADKQSSDSLFPVWNDDYSSLSSRDASLSRVEQKHHPMLKDYLKEEQED